jgi:hypothetical protein
VILCEKKLLLCRVALFSFLACSISPLVLGVSLRFGFLDAFAPFVLSSSTFSFLPLFVSPAGRLIFNPVPVK